MAVYLCAMISAGRRLRLRRMVVVEMLRIDDGVSSERLPGGRVRVVRGVWKLCVGSLCSGAAFSVVTVQCVLCGCSKELVNDVHKVNQKVTCWGKLVLV